MPGDVYVYGQGENISMRDWAELILRIGEEAGYWPGSREIVTTPEPLPPRRERRDGAPCRPREADARDRLAAARLLGGGHPARRSRWYAENRERWLGRVDWLPTGRAELRRA